MRDNRVKNFMWSLGYNGCFVVSSEGRSGGLTLFWPSSICVIVKLFCTNFINVHVTEESGVIW
jgi:hypothetical protein